MASNCLQKCCRAGEGPEQDGLPYPQVGARIHGRQDHVFPATLAQDILQKGLEIPELIDEIYMQIMKQLTNNPKPGQLLVAGS